MSDVVTELEMSLKRVQLNIARIEKAIPEDDIYLRRLLDERKREYFHLVSLVARLRRDYENGES